ncbi:glycosyltransferase [candidate division LCP-89 bacterium B3_LCP]|uniref:Glycosyltransferase n=1 Tax=candidate division LCP-89 bacterium B3_LCP TaxID=2012998 RepID=A0A532UY24_UNCL8|nr:MAG: glycosyltransferase [candidate division LCP-89 bacterium B3_LCP]
MTDEITVSAVIPLLNEEESLRELYELLAENLTQYDSWEIIFVDDGSTDSSLIILEELRSRDARIKIISFQMNYGKSAALDAGFNAALGKYIITLDADLQDDPGEIPNLIAELEKGNDLVSGWKKKRRDPISKTVPSKIWNLLTSILTGLRIHDFNCGLKAYRREVTRRLPVYGEMHRFLPAIVHWEGFRVTEIPVQHHPRKYGKTKYGARRFLNGLLDLLTIQFLVRYKKKPMHLFGLAGLIFTFAGFLILVYLTWGWLNGIWIGDRPLFLLGILLVVFGAQSFSLGLIGEMLTRSSSDQHEYLIRLKEGFDQERR